MKGFPKTVLKVLLPILVLAGAWQMTRSIRDSAPEAQRRQPPPTVLAVEATTLSPTDYPVVLRSQGTVRPTTENTLVTEVTGAITALSEHFVVGGAFSAGEVLLQVDERDYQITLTRALANLAQADAELEEQRALASQAAADWKQLGRRGTPSPLTLREPQVAAAQANLDAATAEVDKARLDLERTRIVGPYDGRVLSADVANGQFVNRGATVGAIHAIDAVDISLPLTSRQLEFVNLPASGVPVDEGLAPTVELETRIGSTTRAWAGRLVRSEGVDSATQQLNVVARVNSPFAVSGSPLRIGQYVDARISGSVLKDVFVVPRAAVRDNGEVLVLDGESRVTRRPVTVAWRDDDVVAIREGLADGDILVTTPMATVVDGTPVRATVDGVDPAPAQRGERGQRAGGAQGGEGGSGQRRGQGSRTGAPESSARPARQSES